MTNYNLELGAKVNLFLSCFSSGYIFFLTAAEIKQEHSPNGNGAEAFKQRGFYLSKDVGPMPGELWVIGELNISSS